jgi:oxygen-independent coproporphyrinogen-3 oxidase
MSVPEEKVMKAASGCALYMHIPFCERKCGYCDFFSIPVQGRDTGAFVDRLVCELETHLAGGAPDVRTIFMGGGTPTILPLDQLIGLLGAIARFVPPEGLVEFTVEANPATMDEEKVRGLVSSGVTRVSVGAQSFFPAELTALGRIHTSADIPVSVGILRRGGARQINLDLMFGVPGQTLETWAESLKRAMDLGPDHLACYALTYEPGTPLATRREEGRVVPCDESLEVEMFELAMEVLQEAGYHHYEISNYARRGCESQHNLMYWRNEPYIGIGPSAVGCVHGTRYRNVADVDQYIQMIDEQGHAKIESETIDTPKLTLEMIMMQLRLAEGLSIAAYRKRTGVDPLVQFQEALPRLTDLGLLVVTDTHVALTRKGRLVADTVIGELAAACGEGDPSTAS